MKKTENFIWRTFEYDPDASYENDVEYICEWGSEYGYVSGRLRFSLDEALCDLPYKLLRAQF